jgi:hypothetical protein
MAGEEDLTWLVGDRNPFDSVDPETLQVIPYSPENVLAYSKKNYDDGILPIEAPFMQHSREEEYEHHDENNVLDKYRSSVRMTRRSTLDEKSADPLRSIAPTQKRPETIDELYEVTLPQVRNQLKQSGLKQVGSIRSYSPTLFEKNKYTSKKSTRHDPFKPHGAIQDPSLNTFTPKQWTGEHPTDAQDDLFVTAVRETSTEFFIEPQPIAYVGDTLSYRILVNSLPDLTIDLVVSMLVTHVTSNRVMLRTERRIRARGQVAVRGELGLTLSLPGVYVVHAQVYLISTEKVLLETHGPQQVIVTTKD